MQSEIRADHKICSVRIYESKSFEIYSNLRRSDVSRKQC
jgi:hypothetical protein